MISLSYNNGENFYSSRITAVKIHPPAWTLAGRGTLFLGSCFADYLYTEFKTAGLKAFGSPFGNIYNPVSLAEAARMISSETPPVKPEDCFNTPGGFRHFMFHNLKTAGSADALAACLNDELAECRNFLLNAEAAVITPGTSQVFRLINKNAAIVNNCHKLPSGMFVREQLRIEETAEALRQTIENLRKVNPDLKIIITVSPVRHLRDDAAENSLSKAVLRCAAAEVCGGRKEQADTSGTWYYPSFEIMLDELRDYRWYADDLCHPSAEAVSYIISRFINSVYDSRFLKFLELWLPVLRDLNHKPINPDSPEYRDFLLQAESKKNALIAEYPDFF